MRDKDIIKIKMLLEQVNVKMEKLKRIKEIVYLFHEDKLITG